jgi:hypothetical protein
MVRPDGTLDMIDSAAVADRLKGEGKRLLGPYVPVGVSVIERTQAERDAEAKALGFVPASDDITQAERRGYCKGWDAAVAHSRTIKGAVHFTDAERERLLWWLRRPVHPGPMKELDVQIMRKLGA